MDMSFSINLTGIMIEDKQVGGYTAYFAELPDVVAEGETKEGAESNLFEALSIVMDARRELADQNKNENSESKNYELSSV